MTKAELQAIQLAASLACMVCGIASLVIGSGLLAILALVFAAVWIVSGLVMASRLVNETTKEEEK